MATNGSTNKLGIFAKLASAMDYCKNILAIAEDKKDNEVKEQAERLLKLLVEVTNDLEEKLFNRQYSWRSTAWRSRAWRSTITRTPRTWRRRW